MRLTEEHGLLKLNTDYIAVIYTLTNHRGHCQEECMHAPYASYASMLCHDLKQCAVFNDAILSRPIGIMTKRKIGLPLN